MQLLAIISPKLYHGLSIDFRSFFLLFRFKKVHTISTFDVNNFLTRLFYFLLKQQQESNFKENKFVI